VHAGSTKGLGRRNSLKAGLRKYLQERDLQSISDAAVRKRTLGALTSLTFDPDPLIQWRAVEGTGVAAARITQDNTEYVKEHLRRLYWFMSEESGSVCAYAPALMGEIIHQDPALFSSYLPILAAMISHLAEEDLGRFEVYILWGLGRIGHAAGDHVAKTIPEITRCLDSPDPQIRGTAIWCLDRTNHASYLTNREDLLQDDQMLELYENGTLKRVRVSSLVHRAITKKNA